MAIWAELKKVVNSDFSKPLNEFINEILDTKIRNHLYRSDDYLQVSASTTKTLVSSEKTATGTGTYNFKALLLGSFTIPANVYNITVTASLKTSTSLVYPYIYIFYSDHTGASSSGTGNITFVSGDDVANTYTTGTTTIEIFNITPGKTLNFYIMTGDNSYTISCNSLKVAYKTVERVVTTEKYLINTVKTVLRNDSSNHLLFTQLPRAARSELIYARSDSGTYIPKIFIFNNTTYLYSIGPYSILKVGF